MGLNLGNVRYEYAEIIGVFDLDATTVQKSTRAFLRRAQQEGRVTDADGGLELPKSFVLTAQGVVLTALSSATLQKRILEPKF